MNSVDEILREIAIDARRRYELGEVFGAYLCLRYGYIDLRDNLPEELVDFRDILWDLESLNLSNNEILWLIEELEKYIGEKDED